MATQVTASGAISGQTQLFPGIHLVPSPIPGLPLIPGPQQVPGVADISSNQVNSLPIFKQANDAANLAKNVGNGIGNAFDSVISALNFVFSLQFLYVIGGFALLLLSLAMIVKKAG